MAGARTPRSVRTARDNARARELGYKSYYDWRAHDSGRIPPSEPRASGERLARARGHRSAADLRAALKRDALVLTTELTRGKGGRYSAVEITVVDAAGVERVFTLRGRAASQASLRRLADLADERGALLSPSKSLNLRRIAEPDEDEEELDEELDEEDEEE